MLRSERIREVHDVCGPMRSAGVLLLLALTAAGCSADLGRFDFPSAGFAPERSGSTSAIPTPSEPMLGRGSGLTGDERYAYDRSPGGERYQPRGDAVYGGVTDGDRGVSMTRPGYDERSSALPQSERMTALPPTRQQDHYAARDTRRHEQREPQQTYAPASRAPVPTVRTVPVSTVTAPDNSVEVQPGDTLSSIARQQRVSISELMSINNLQSPILRPGQRLALPRGRRAVTQRVAAAPISQPEAREEAPITTQRQEQPEPVAQTSAPSGWQGTHTIAAGESLYGIARKHNVKVAELQAVNGITEVRKIRPGTVIKVPAAAPAAGSSRLAEADSSDEAAPIGRPSPVTLRPRVINGAPGAPAKPKRVASLGPAAQTANDAGLGSIATNEPADAAPQSIAGTSAKFRWPAKGKVIASFGLRPDKSHNDGINIAVPQGAEVLATESGTVAYAGNELKGYGNLVLIRHENNWVSAYAHNDQLLVKRGDTVRRGQVIAKAGNTGSVDQPQVHFELRQDSKPVDPLPHMEKP